jgi:hypothetical protein
VYVYNVKVNVLYYKHAGSDWSLGPVAWQGRQALLLSQLNTSLCHQAFIKINLLNSNSHALNTRPSVFVPLLRFPGPYNDSLRHQACRGRSGAHRNVNTNPATGQRVKKLEARREGGYGGDSLILPTGSTTVLH